MKIKAAVLNRMGAPSALRRDRSRLRSRRSSWIRPAAARCWSGSPPPGLCHSDLSVINGDRPRPMPMALGHEAAGVVEELGGGVDDLAVGDHVVMVFVPSCGHCVPCAEGRPALCEPGAAANGAGTLLSGARRLHATATTVNHHLGCSAFAEYATVSRRSLVKIDPRAAARRSGAVRLRGADRRRRGRQHRAGAGRRPSVAVIGLGGVGLAALLGAVAAGARADRRRRPVRRQARPGAAARRDAHRQRRATPTRVEQIRAATGGGVEFAFEMAGLGARAGTGLQDHPPRRHDGHGRPAAADRHLAAAAVNLVAEERTVKGSYIGTCVPTRDIPRYIELYRRGRLPVDRLMSGTLKLEEINAGFDRLHEGKAIRAGGGVLTWTPFEYMQGDGRAVGPWAAGLRWTRSRASFAGMAATDQGRGLRGRRLPSRASTPTGSRQPAASPGCGRRRPSCRPTLAGTLPRRGAAKPGIAARDARQDLRPARAGSRRTGEHGRGAAADGRGAAARRSVGPRAQDARGVQGLDAAAPAQPRAQHGACWMRGSRRPALRQGRSTRRLIAGEPARAWRRGAGAVGRDGQRGAAGDAALGAVPRDPARTAAGQHRSAPRRSRSWPSFTARCSASRRATELDDVHRTVTELRREVRALRREKPRGAASRQRPAAEPRPPSRRPVRRRKRCEAATTKSTHGCPATDQARARRSPRPRNLGRKARPRREAARRDPRRGRADRHHAQGRGVPPGQGHALPLRAAGRSRRSRRRC